MENTETKNLRSKVWRPDGTTDQVLYIACDVDHYGNLVAEGRLTKEEYWPALYNGAKREISTLRENLAKEIDARNAFHANLYRSYWRVGWLEYQLSTNTVP